jgi:ABC-type transport system involved in multi-copper enzyme maturation permease subunit
MFVPLLKNETLKLRHRSVLWIELGIMALAVAGIFTMLYVVSQVNVMPAEERALIEQLAVWPGSIMMSISMAASQNLGGLLIIVLTSLVVAQEYQWQTLTLDIRQGASRPLIILSKLLILLVAALLITAVPLIVGTGVSALTTIGITGSLDASLIDPAQVALSVVRTAYTLLPFMALSFLVAVVTRSVAGSIGVGLGYLLFVEGIAAELMLLVGGVLADIAKFMPGQMAKAIIAENDAIMAAAVSTSEGAAGLVDNLLDPGAAAIGVAVYTVLFIGLAIWQFTRQDLTV